MVSGWAKGETMDGPRRKMDTWVGEKDDREEEKGGINIVRVFGLKGYNKRNTMYCNTNANSCDRAEAASGHF